MLNFEIKRTCLFYFSFAGFSIATCFDSGDFCFTMLCLKKPTQMKRALILATFGACFFLFVYFTSRVDQQSLMQYKYEDGNVLARLSVPFSQQTNCSENWSIDEFEKGSQKKVSQLMNPSNFISVLAGWCRNDHTLERNHFFDRS